MLTEKEKLEQRDHFCKSEKFGIDTFWTLFMFKHNSLGMLTTVGFLGDLVQKIDDKAIFPSNLNNELIVQIKQYVIVDAISKLLVITEGLLVLCHSLSIGYNSVSQNMLNYNVKQVWNIIQKIKTNEFSWAKILAFLPVEQFDNLDEKEKAELKMIYSDTIEAISQTFLELISFYEKYNIVYNKSKHGLSLEPGGFLESERTKDLFHSSLSALDHRKNEDKMPSGYYVSKIDKNTDTVWFNVESRINFNQKLFSEIASNIHNLEILCSYIVDNHLTFANNCGESYLPVHNEKGQFSVDFLTRKPRDETKEKILENLNKKILPNMVTSDIEFSMKRTYTKEPLSSDVKENPVTNVFMKDSDEI